MIRSKLIAEVEKNESGKIPLSPQNVVRSGANSKGEDV
ncbi:hypothetical protein C2W59_03105 [Bacillus pumilus]|nr:hypothetical protein C2W59_03105 [Bacillus pumilus]